MTKLGYLFLAYSAIWTGLFIFLLAILRRLTKLEEQLLELKEKLKR
ncbi:MAG: CcmD family protein [candidate division KSB1 bacterium]|nr:CcmD family protein [candidate division KSB1 bacterium]MDZ7345458.1 CcmD family protein [candidate division KSB1 bacterium]